MDEGALTEYLSLMTQIQALLDSGISPEITQKILFENARRFFEKNL